jgi:glycosyltransferase involved in cell wall biosynthesis
VNIAEVPASGTIASRPLRICLLGYRSHPYGGGQGIYIKYLSKALVNAGHSVDVISGEPYPHLDPRVKLIKMPGLNLFEHPTHHAFALRWRHLLSWTDFFEWWSMLTGGFSEPYCFGRRVAHYLKDKRDHYDIIHDNQSLSYGLIQLQNQGWPVLATFHHPITYDLRISLQAEPDWRLRLLKRRWHWFLNMQKNVVRKLKHVVTVSECSRQDIAKDFSVDINHIDLIYNGIDTDEFVPPADAVREKFRIMCTASADQPLKGMKYLIEALYILKEEYPELHLLVVGKPQENGYILKLIKRLHLQDRVRFVSGISTETLVRYYSEATLVVCPSLYEGFGLPAGEAMACEAPVISSNGGALPEVVGDAGIIVPKADRKALAVAIKDLLDHPEKRHQLGRAGRQRILDSFCWNKAAQQFTRYYHPMLDRAAVANP